MLAQLSGFSKNTATSFAVFAECGFRTEDTVQSVVTFAKNHLESNIYSL